MRAHRIFLVDDHPLVREWLANLLRQQDDLAVCGEADNAETALQQIEMTAPEIAIVDLSLAKGWGLDLIRDIVARAPATRIIVLTMHDEKIYGERTMHAGARGYVMKRETTKAIVSAIRQVLKGELYFNSDLPATPRSASGRKLVAAAPIDALSDREREVFRLVGLGVPTRHIALSLEVSVKTVHSYHARIREKLQIANMSELVREAVRWCEGEPG